MQTSIELEGEPEVGDIVAIARDVLVEIEQRSTAAKTWRFFARGTRGRLSDWLPQDVGRVVIIDEAKFVARVRRDALTRCVMRPES
jgi:hypothetical protein